MLVLALMTIGTPTTRHVGPALASCRFAGQASSKDFLDRAVDAVIAIDPIEMPLTTWLTVYFVRRTTEQPGHADVEQVAVEVDARRGRRGWRRGIARGADAGDEDQETKSHSA